MADELEICKFYIEGRCRFGEQCRNLHEGQVLMSSQRKPKKTKVKVGKTDNNDSDSSKLPSMKTARDVIQRIQWDTDVPSQHFTIGYLDRFVGVVEQPFDMFDWSSDLASVDQNVLAIPQHRIQYFKYRGRKLWDKNERLDLIFGSTSFNKADISSLLSSIDEELLFKEDTVLDMFPGNTACAVVDDDKAPTHFLAIRMDNLETVSALVDTLTNLSLPECSCAKILPAELYHCTLALLTLDSIEQINHCVTLLKSLGPDYFVDAPKYVELKGLATFRDRVLYSRIVPNERLESLVCSLVDFLKYNDVYVFERPKKFHVSLVKGNKNLMLLDHDKITGLDIEPFGQQPVEFVHLCALREAPDLDGFYRVLASVPVIKCES